MIVAISGIRDIAPSSQAIVEMEVLEELLTADELRFGGALGVDTVALLAACDADIEVRLKVYLPWTLLDQPQEARAAIRACPGLQMAELKLPRKPWAPLRRNDVMLTGAEKLLAFTDGRQTGGTAYTIQKAQQLGLQVEIFHVEGTKAANPRLNMPAAPAPVFAWVPYLSRTATGGDALLVKARDVVWALKDGTVLANDVRWLASQMAAYMQTEPAFRGCGYVAAMPRRTPGVASDLEPLVAALAPMLGKAPLHDWLRRTVSPVGGRIAHKRLRFHADEHIKTMRVIDNSIAGSDVILLDNVITSFAGTMVGGQRAVLRDTGSPPVGMAALWSGVIPAF